MELKYAYKPDDKKTAVGMVRGLDISFKHAVVVCERLRGMRLQDAIKLLDAVIALEESVPFKRFNTGIGHRRGLGKDNIAKYPKKAAFQMLKLMRNIETNAEYKGLDTERLKIIHIQALRGISRKKRRPRGRWRLWKQQLVSVQAVVEET